MMREFTLLTMCIVLSVSDAESPYTLQNQVTGKHFKSAAESPYTLQKHVTEKHFKSDAESPYTLQKHVTEKHFKSAAESPYKLQKHVTEKHFKSAAESPYKLQKHVTEKHFKSAAESPYKLQKHVTEKHLKSAAEPPYKLQNQVTEKHFKSAAESPYTLQKHVTKKHFKSDAESPYTLQKHVTEKHFKSAAESPYTLQKHVTEKHFKSAAESPYKLQKQVTEKHYFKTSFYSLENQAKDLDSEVLGRSVMTPFRIRQEHINIDDVSQRQLTTRSSFNSTLSKDMKDETPPVVIHPTLAQNSRMETLYNLHRKWNTAVYSPFIPNRRTNIIRQGTTWIPKEAVLERQDKPLDKRHSDVAKKSWLYSYNMKIPRVFKSPFRPPHTKAVLEKSPIHKERIQIGRSQRDKERYRSENKMAEGFEFQKNSQRQNKIKTVLGNSENVVVTNFKYFNNKNNDNKSPFTTGITSSLVTKPAMSRNFKPSFHQSRQNWKYSTIYDSTHHRNINPTKENLKIHKHQLTRQLDNKNTELPIQTNYSSKRTNENTKMDIRTKERVGNSVTHTTIRKPGKFVQVYHDGVKMRKSRSRSPFSSSRYYVRRHNQYVNPNNLPADAETEKRREKQKRVSIKQNNLKFKVKDYFSAVASLDKPTRHDKNRRTLNENKQRKWLKYNPNVEQLKVSKSPFLRMRNGRVNSRRYERTRILKQTYTQHKGGYHDDGYRYTPVRRSSDEDEYTETKNTSMTPHGGTTQPKPFRTSTPTPTAETTTTASLATIQRHKMGDVLTNGLSLEVETSTQQSKHETMKVNHQSTLKKGQRIVWRKNSRRNWGNGSEKPNSGRHGFIFSCNRRTTKYSEHIKSSTENQRENSLEHNHVTSTLSPEYSNDLRPHMADDISTSHHSFDTETSNLPLWSTQKRETGETESGLKQGHRIVWRRKPRRKWHDGKQKDNSVGREFSVAIGRHTTIYPVQTQIFYESRKRQTMAMSTDQDDSTTSHLHKTDDILTSRHSLKVETTTRQSIPMRKDQTTKPQFTLKQGQRIVWRRRPQRNWRGGNQKHNSDGHRFIFSSGRRTTKYPVQTGLFTESRRQTISELNHVTINAAAAALNPYDNSLHSSQESRKSIANREANSKSPWSHKKQNQWQNNLNRGIQQEARTRKGYRVQRIETPFSNFAINARGTKKNISQRKGFMFSRFRQTHAFKITNETKNRFSKGHGSKVQGHGSKVQGHGNRDQENEMKDQGHRNRDHGHGSKVQGHGNKVQGHEREFQKDVTKHPVYKTDSNVFDGSIYNSDERKRWVKNAGIINGSSIRKHKVSIFSKTSSNKNTVVQTSKERFYNDWIKRRHGKKVNKPRYPNTEKPSWSQRSTIHRSMTTSNRTILTNQNDPVQYLENTLGDAPAIVINKNNKQTPNSLYLKINQTRPHNITRQEFLKTHSQSPFFKQRPVRVKISEKQKPLPPLQKSSQDTRDKYPHYKQIPTDVELPKGTPEWKSKDYDYGEVLYKSMLFYEAQRSGTLPRNSRVLWRGDSGIEDQGIYGEDLSGGWYDAGDYMKFGLPMAGSTTLLIWGLLEFHNAYEETGLLDNIYDTIKWPLDYFIKAHPTKFEFYAQVGDPYIDHSYWGRPEDMTMYRPSYRLTPERPGSDVIGETAAAMAAGYIAFKKRDPDYAYKLLRHAEELYEFAERYQGRYSDSIPIVQEFYESSGYRDELSWAAAWLYKATNLRKYLVAADRNYDRGACWSQSWDEKRAGAMVLLYQLTKQDKYLEDIEATMKSWLPGGDIPYTPKGLAFGLQWGSLRYAANMAMVALVAANSGINAEEYRSWAKSQIHYMLGDSGRSYVVGFGEQAPSSPHHASSSCDPPPWTCTWADFSKAEANPHTLFGALVGGPDMFDNFVDDRADYIQNEVTCDYNAGFQSAVAGLMQDRLRKTNTVDHLRFKNAADIKLKEIRQLI